MSAILLQTVNGCFQFVVLKYSFALSARYFPGKNRARECPQIMFSTVFYVAGNLVHCRFSCAMFFNTISTPGMQGLVENVAFGFFPLFTGRLPNASVVQIERSSTYRKLRHRQYLKVPGVALARISQGNLAALTACILYSMRLSTSAFGSLSMKRCLSAPATCRMTSARIVKARISCTSSSASCKSWFSPITAGSSNRPK
jgi:multisubunit Na+/H+ antiporter MnhB subunit